ncbi:MAG: metallophosphoesterase [Deltaproteobacteria bacterium]|nr:metallophosphoesterase [Deltaproteobacteria bacterium]
MFGTLLTVAFLLLLGHVLWRAASLPWLARLRRRHFWIAGGGLTLIFVLGRFVGHDGEGALAATLELLGMNLLGTVFLLWAALLVAELLTGFGWLLRRRAPAVRAAALGAGALLAVVAMVQGLRAPAVVEHEVALEGLAPELDGLRVVAVSDAHLGSQLGAGWLAPRVATVQALEPDLILLLGDIFEGHGAPPGVARQLAGLRAPLGKLFVEGNHDSRQRHGGEGFHALLEGAGFRFLADRSVVLEGGLVVAGVTSTTHRARGHDDSDPLGETLAALPGGPTILLSHAPWEVERAAEAGVDLMLSGHTHGGQIWPFSYLVATRYAHLVGRHRVGGLELIISRGLGTWGPRMRLWPQGEILLLTLRPAQRGPG